MCCRRAREFLSRLRQYQLECERVIEEVEECLEFLTVLKTDYVRVATKTNALHEACENLLEDQVSLLCNCVSSGYDSYVMRSLYISVY